jgi:hypothetical protein
VSSYKENTYLVVEAFDEQDRLVERTWKDPRTDYIHRVGGPALQKFDPETSQLEREVWIDRFNHGKHRDGNLPSDISIDPQTGVVILEEYYRNGRLHRDDDGPAEIYRNSETGQITGLIFRHEGDRHRDGDLPAEQDFDPATGALVREEYFRSGVRHRDNGPAIIEYDTSGQPIPTSLEYYRDGLKVKPGYMLSPTEP